MAAMLRKLGGSSAPTVKIPAPAGDPPRGRTGSAAAAGAAAPAAPEGTGSTEPRAQGPAQAPQPREAPRRPPPELNEYLRARVPRGEVRPTISVPVFLLGP